jgi:DNA (cytosine-5)-methyltransferase 1
MLTSLEICAGAGGQALGLERAGFEHLAVVELDAHACTTLRHNRPQWTVLEEDLHGFDATPYHGVDLFAGGVPCPPFSKAGKQLGYLDDRDLFPVALRLIKECDPKAVLLENVRGLLDPVFADYRADIQSQLEDMGYRVFWRLHHASDFGVPQLRPRTLLVALKEEYADSFEWPEPRKRKAPTVGQTLRKAMAAAGWKGAEEWSLKANRIAPTLVGGSKKHGGPDLGPTRARAAWAVLGVDGKGLADAPPAPDHEGMPRLTVEMAARIQGFPSSWTIVGKKTNAYRQVGNAFPPPVAEAVGKAIATALADAPAGAQTRLELESSLGRIPQAAAA